MNRIPAMVILLLFYCVHLFETFVVTLLLSDTFPLIGLGVLILSSICPLYIMKDMKEENEVPVEQHRPPKICDKLDHIRLYQLHFCTNIQCSI